jgi:nucleotide-binding universal stress UspA family protein
MTDQQQKWVLACIDGSKHTTAVCDYAAWISKGIDKPIKLLHNLEHRENLATADLSGSIGLGSQEHLLEELTELEAQRSKLELKKGKLMLEAAKERVEQAGITEPKVSQRHGSLVESLIDLEDAIQVLVLGIRGEAHSHDDSHLGAHLESAVRALHRPILVVNAEFSVPERIMLAYDGSDAANKALDTLVSTPIFKGMPCHLVFAGGHEQPAKGKLSEAERQLSAAGFEVTVATVDGKCDEALFNYSQKYNIDLTIMGAYSHTRFRELLLGSFTTKMLLKMNKPVLLLR